MSCVNISKNSLFVTSFLVFTCLLTNCKFVSSHGLGLSKKNQESTEAFSDKYEKPQILGTIKSAEITESSGLVESRCQENTLWTHNDSGDGNYIYALDKKGRKLGTFRVGGAKNIDWEDLATFKTPNGDCFLYIGDIGNNDLDRKQMTIYRVKEPALSADNETDRSDAAETELAEAIKFSYADAPHNSETLMVHPLSGDIYLLTKEFDSPAGVYKLPANYNIETINRISKIADFKVPAVPNGLLTGGEISPDGKRAVICDYLAGYEIELPTADKNFDDIWKAPLAKIDLGERKQGEAIAYSSDGKSIYATSEKKNSPLILVNGK